MLRDLYPKLSNRGTKTRFTKLIKQIELHLPSEEEKGKDRYNLRKEQ